MFTWQKLLMQPVATGLPVYRYWRITWTAPGSGADGFLDCREIELRASVGGADLTVPSTPITNSGALWASFGSTPSQLVDNSTSSICTSGYVANSWTTFDLGSPQAVAEFAYNTGNVSRAPTGLSISGSNDGSSFTLLKAYTGITGYVGSTYNTFATT